MVAEQAPAAFGSDYDAFVDWDARIGREAPFFRRVFETVGARNVIDVGSGSARHAIEFATWGIAVDAVDPDEAMIVAAEGNVAAKAASISDAGGVVRLDRAGFGKLAGRGLGPADALVCTGNALPHVDGAEGLRRALADFFVVTRPGGVVVLHLLNHARLLVRKPRSLPPVVRETPEGTRVFLRVIDYPEGAKSFGFDFVNLTRGADGSWTASSRRSLHTALPFETLHSELEIAGFRVAEVLGSHDGKPFDAENDESIIIVAYRL